METGFAGTASDGLTELDSAGTLTSAAPDADNGNVVQTVKLGLPAAGRRAARTVALGFGTTSDAAVSAAQAASAAPFAATWPPTRPAGGPTTRICCRPAAAAGAHGIRPTAAQASAYWLSANVLKASEDKTFPGATAASLASPWGQAVPAGQPASDGLAPYFGSYREVFPRDTYEAFTGFLTDGDLATARQIVRFLFDDMQRPDGSFPRNGLLNGQAAPDTGGLQLDETADPILMAWQAGLAGDTALYTQHIRPAADFLVANGPADGVERWEEQTGFSPSTMADEVAGLVAAAAIARVQGDTASQRLFLATADNFRRLILATTVTSNGPLSAQPYFIRVDKTGNPNQAFSYSLGNGDPTSQDQRSVVDQGFLELVRLGELPASDPLVANSLKVTGATIGASTPSGTGILRYNGDGYGDCEVAVFQDCQVNGQPWATTDQGTGHPWPVLSGENAEYQILAGDTGGGRCRPQLHAELGVRRGPGARAGVELPGRARVAVRRRPGHRVDRLYRRPAGRLGRPADLGPGPAAPADLGPGGGPAAGAAVDRGRPVPARRAGRRAAAPLSVTAPLTVSGGNVPANLTRPSVTVNAASATVTGSTAPGATVQVAVDRHGTRRGGPATTITTVTADSSGAFAVPVRCSRAPTR